MEPIFRTAMFGFKKEDVSEFLARHSRSTEKALAEKDQQISELQKTLSAREEEFAGREDAVKKAEERSARILDREEKNRSLAARIAQEAESLRNNAALARESGQAEKENSNRLKEEIFRLSEECRAAREKAAKFSEKAKKFDVLAGVLSDMITPGKVPEEADADELPAFVYPDFAGDPAENAPIGEKLEALLANVEQILALLGELAFEDQTEDGNE